MNDRFIKIGETLFNIDYIKTFHCNDEECHLIEANTQVVSAAKTAYDNPMAHDMKYYFSKAHNLANYNSARQTWAQLSKK